MTTDYLQGGCQDVFKAFLVKNAKLTGAFDFPAIRGCNEIPRKLITFSKALKEQKDFHQWVVFYEDDFRFERIWNSPRKYLKVLKKFDGIILPDFSVYYDFPMALQIWNIYRSRAIGCWLESEGIKVIPNIRFGDQSTFECCCDGISKHGVICIGTLGCIKDKDYRVILEEGIQYIVSRLEPEILLLYGSQPSKMDYLKKTGTKVILFKPDYSFFEKEEE